MILKTLFAGVACLGFMLPRTAAQYEYAHHHQQYMTIERDVKRFDTKALTPVKEKGGQLKWAFVSTIKEKSGQALKTLLVKLNGNNVTPNEFSFEWAKVYKNKKGGASMDVYDVFHVPGKKPKYILCGSIENKKGTNKGFLALVDKDGKFKKGKIYENASVLRSVVRVHNDSNGYVAVGSWDYRASAGDAPARTAIFLSVDKNLNRLCLRGFEGTYNFDLEAGTTEFNKVIKYTVKNSDVSEKLFGVAGEATIFPRDADVCKSNSDVVVALVDKDCKVKNVKQFGDPGSNNQEVNERGLSLTQWDDKKGGLVITGHTKAVSPGCERIDFNDILVFKSDGNLNIDWEGRYGFTDDTFEIDNSLEIGTAIQMSDGAKSQVLVAGQAETPYFVDGATKTSTMDAFLLALNKKTGNVNNVDLFGMDLSKEIDNGALFRGNLDLHMTQDNNAFMVGNTKTSKNPNTASKPYLIERYKKRNSKCEDRRFDSGFVKEDVRLKTTEVHTFDVFFNGTSKLKVTTEDATLTNKVTCEKKINDPNPPEGPSGAPSKATPSPTPPLVAPTIALPTIALPTIVTTPPDPNPPVPEPPVERPEIPLGPIEPTPTIPIFLPGPTLIDAPFERPEIPLGPIEPTPTIPIFLPGPTLIDAPFERPEIPLGPIEPTPTIPVFLPGPTLIDVPSIGDFPFGFRFLLEESHKTEEELVTPLDPDENGVVANP